MCVCVWGGGGLFAAAAEDCLNFLSIFCIVLCCPFWEFQVSLPGSGYSSCKSSSIHSYQCVQYFHVSKQWYMAASVWDL